ncbi:MAG: DUF1934 family protein [Bacilli bacterium]
MKKINIYASIAGRVNAKSELNTVGTIDDNVISYDDGEVKVKVCLLNDEISITRKTSEMLLNLQFKESTKKLSEYKINLIPSVMNVETNTKKLEIRNNSLTVYYDLKINGVHSDTFTYYLEWSD